MCMKEDTGGLLLMFESRRQRGRLCARSNRRGASRLAPRGSVPLV